MANFTSCMLLNEFEIEMLKSPTDFGIELTKGFNNSWLGKIIAVFSLGLFAYISSTKLPAVFTWAICLVVSYIKMFFLSENNCFDQLNLFVL